MPGMLRCSARLERSPNTSRSPQGPFQLRHSGREVVGNRWGAWVGCDYKGREVQESPGGDRRFVERESRIIRAYFWKHLRPRQWKIYCRGHASNARLAWQTGAAVHSQNHRGRRS